MGKASRRTGAERIAARIKRRDTKAAVRAMAVIMATAIRREQDSAR